MQPGRHEARDLQSLLRGMADRPRDGLPPYVTTQKEADSLAKSKGLATGRDDKYLVPERLCGCVGTA